MWSSSSSETGICDAAIKELFRCGATIGAERQGAVLISDTWESAGSVLSVPGMGQPS